MKNKIKQIPLILSLIFFIFSVAVFLFLYKEIRNKNKISQEAQVKWQQEEYRKDSVKSVEQIVKSTQTERGLIEKHFVYGSDVVPFLDMVESLALKSGIVVEVSSVDLDKDNSGLMVDLKIGGSFEAIYKFILLLENSIYELDMTGIDIKGSDTSTDAGEKWQGNLKVKVLSFLP